MITTSIAYHMNNKKKRFLFRGMAIELSVSPFVIHLLNSQCQCGGQAVKRYRFAHVHYFIKVTALLIHLNIAKRINEKIFY